MSRERTVNFDQQTTFPKNSKPTKVWLWLVVNKITENKLSFAAFLRVHSNLKEVSYFP